MVNLFIDTNIFLSFFHLTSEDLEELKKLIVLIDNGEIRLFLPECGIRCIADRIPTQAGQQSDDCGQPMKAA
jgi:hypothetical protein